ncbi:MAG: hypothetical protein RL559_985 [Pseudomonadota bacterium]
MNSQELQALVHQVLGLAFLLGMLLGGLIQRTHFCTMGAISDLVLMGDAMRLRQWVLAVVVGMLGLALAAVFGFMDPRASIYAAERFPWLSYALGGFVLGVGMVLASGCPTKNLVRLAGGSLKALVVLVFLALGALGALRGAPALLRAELETVNTGVASGPFVGQWLAAQAGLGFEQGVLAAALLIGVPLLLWVARDARLRSGAPLQAGLGIGLVLLLAWWVSGVWGFVPEHPDTLDAVFVATGSGRMEGLSFTAPLAQWLDLFAHAADLGLRLTFGMALVPGVVLGAGLSAWLRGEWRWEGFSRTSDLARHLVGALLMGMGGVYAMGCSFGQGITGVSTLNWGSLLAVAAMVLGCWLTLRVQLWLAERD